MQAFMQIFFCEKIPNLRYCASGGLDSNFVVEILIGKSIRVII